MESRKGGIPQPRIVLAGERRDVRCTFWAWLHLYPGLGSHTPLLVLHTPSILLGSFLLQGRRWGELGEMSSPAVPAAGARASGQAGGSSGQDECSTAFLQRCVILSSAHPGAHGAITKEMAGARPKCCETRSIFLLKHNRLSCPNVTDKSSLNNSLRQIN